jgi:hypothetical protein
VDPGDCGDVLEKIMSLGPVGNQSPKGPIIWYVLHEKVKFMLTVPWLRLLVAGLSPRMPGFDPGSVHMGLVVDKLAGGQIFSQVLRFYPVSFIQLVLHYTKKSEKKLIVLITGLHKKTQGCCASVASAAGPFTAEQTWILYWSGYKFWCLGAGQRMSCDGLNRL